MPQRPSSPPPQFPATRPAAPPTQTATSRPAPAASQLPTASGSAFLPGAPMDFRPTPRGFPAIQQPAPTFTPSGYYAPPGVPKRRPTGLLVALFSALTLLIDMVATSFTNDQPDSTAVSTDYKNEGWKVPTVDKTPPPVVVPKNNTEAETLTENNPLYGTSLESPVRCDLEPLPDDKQKDEELEADLQAYLDYLTRAWGFTPEEAGYRASQPKITVFPKGGVVTMECGRRKLQNTSYYTANQRIYIAQDMFNVFSTDLSKARAIFNLIIAHGYGHTIQRQSGILVSGDTLTRSGSDSRATEISRRLETQADCFAGAAMNPLRQGLKLTDMDRQDILDIIVDLGDDRLRERNNGDPDKEGDYDKDKNRCMWLERGLNPNGSLDQCNTLTAPPGKVKQGTAGGH